jgi:hypothetical protein
MLPEFSFPTVTYGIAFPPHCVAIDKFVVGGVATAIDCRSIQFSFVLLAVSVFPSLDEGAVNVNPGSVLTTRLSAFFMAVLSWRHFMTQRCATAVENAIGPWYRLADVSVAWCRVAPNVSSEYALLAPANSKASPNTIVP